MCPRLCIRFDLPVPISYVSNVRINIPSYLLFHANDALKRNQKEFFFIILCKLVVMYRPSEMVNMVFDCGNKYVLFYSSNRPSDVHNWIRHTCAIPLIGHFLSLNVEATWNFRPYIQYITITLFFLFNNFIIGRILRAKSSNIKW